MIAKGVLETEGHENRSHQQKNLHGRTTFPMQARFGLRYEFREEPHAGLSDPAIAAVSIMARELDRNRDSVNENCYEENTAFSGCTKSPARLPGRLPASVHLKGRPWVRADGRSGTRSSITRLFRSMRSTGSPVMLWESQFRGDALASIIASDPSMVGPCSGAWSRYLGGRKPVSGAEPCRRS